MVVTIITTVVAAVAMGGWCDSSSRQGSGARLVVVVAGCDPFHNKT